MHQIKVRNLKKNENGKFDPEIGDWRNPYKAVIKFGDTIKLPELAHYDGMDDAVIMTKAEYEALTQGHNIAVPYKFIEGLKTIRTVIDDAIAEAEQRG